MPAALSCAVCPYSRIHSTHFLHQSWYFLVNYLNQNQNRNCCEYWLKTTKDLSPLGGKQPWNTSQMYIGYQYNGTWFSHQSPVPGTCAERNVPNIQKPPQIEDGAGLRALRIALSFNQNFDQKLRTTKNSLTIIWYRLSQYQNQSRTRWYLFTQRTQIAPAAPDIEKNNTRNLFTTIS